MSFFTPHVQKRNGSVSFKRLIERMFPEASAADTKVLLHMARPKDYLPKAKPDQGVRGGVREGTGQGLAAQGQI